MCLLSLWCELGFMFSEGLLDCLLEVSTQTTLNKTDKQNICSCALHRQGYHWDDQIRHLSVVESHLCFSLNEYWLYFLLM